MPGPGFGPVPVTAAAWVELEVLPSAQALDLHVAPGDLKDAWRGLLLIHVSISVRPGTGTANTTVGLPGGQSICRNASAHAAPGAPAGLARVAKLAADLSSGSPGAQSSGAAHPL